MGMPIKLLLQAGRVHTCAELDQHTPARQAPLSPLHH